jgi:peptidoglycan/xylan/chitin deacetylase (PgdA/CDA1 family)
LSRFPVLMYHRILSAQCPIPGGDQDEARYAVPLDQFEWQMDRIAASGRQGVSMKMISDAIADDGSVPTDWVAITFDDGNTSDFSHALPILLEREFHATFYICGNRVDAMGGLGRDMLMKMATAGMHIGSHAMTHRFLTALTGDEEREELRASRELLESIVDQPVDHFAPPGGRHDERTLRALRELGYVAVGNSEFGFNNCAGARFSFRRVPVVAATSPAAFKGLIEASNMKTLPLYIRHAILRTVRNVLGEDGYRRVRNPGSWSN